MARSGRTGTRRGTLADVAGSALTAVLVFGAVPAVLFVLVGDPLSRGLGHQWQHPARTAMATLAVVAWVAWAACCTQLIRAVAMHVRRGSAGVPSGAAVTERIAARIAIGILALSSLGAPLAVVSSAGATSAVVSRVGPAVTPAAAAAAAVTNGRTSEEVPVAATYIVRPGDSLWSIAEEQLGDGADWTAIAALNLGRTMPDGHRFVDPSLIHTGWDLLMPINVGATATAADVIRPAPAPSAPPVTTKEDPTTPPAPAAAPAPAPVQRDAPTAPQADPHPMAEVGSDAPAHARSSSLPELMALGLGAVGCAALARRARRRRLLEHWGSSPPAAAVVPSEGAIDTDVLLQRFDGIPALDALEAANCLLGQTLYAEGYRSGSPGIRAVCVSAAGVSFWLAEPGQPAPPPFTLTADGGAWQVDHRSLNGKGSYQPHLPVVLPVGEDDEGTWLVPIRAGSCLPIVGPAAAEFWRAARPVQEAWAWADTVVVTDDPAVAAREAQRYGGGDEQAFRDECPILFCGDPALLPAHLSARISVVTFSTDLAGDLTVLVDRNAATIHPLGRTVRPHLVSPATARLIDELVRPPIPSAGTDDAAVEMDSADDPDLADEVVEGDERDVPPRPLQEAELPATAALRPGVVEVKLLTMTPRLDGLCEELPPNRARRATELVAYLALQRPDPVTSDRLRTRVLGSSDADAAVKTLFNTATAARRAMGADGEGQPLFPLGNRTGHYRVSDGVTVDVQRAATLAAVGNAEADPARAMAHLRAALELVEGEPLANALSGYTWWESEGHGARIAAVLVNAACNLAALAVKAELFDLAQRGLERARLVDPYSEALSRVAMQVAAAAGDADRLRREWRECQRRVDELDPGSSPSPRTERLYGELAQQVLV